tara:strand:- start:1600 stop:1926 length:327 start_codon:yes stop_codon:yes gene_type:complete
MSKGDSPYSTGIASKNISQTMSTTNQQAQYKAEERAQHSPKILPHELDQVNQVLSTAFTALADLSGMIQAAKSNREIDEDLVEAISCRVDKINELILDLPEYLAKIAI